MKTMKITTLLFLATTFTLSTALSFNINDLGSDLERGSAVTTNDSVNSFDCSIKIQNYLPSGLRQIVLNKLNKKGFNLINSAEESSEFSLYVNVYEDSRVEYYEPRTGEVVSYTNEIAAYVSLTGKTSSSEGRAVSKIGRFSEPSGTDALKNALDKIANCNQLNK